MKSHYWVKTAALILLVFQLGCQSEKKIQQSVEKTLKENPKILMDIIRENPADFMEALQTAANSAKQELAKRREEQEKKKFEESFANPLKPEIRSHESFRGTKDAPIVLVEYSDFECPFCKRGFETVQALLKKYDGKIQFIYKHLPLSFHKNAKIASQYYEAIRIQDEQKAFKFHDLIYERQSSLKRGEKFLTKLAKEVGADMSKLKKDVNSKRVLQIIAEDEKEAAKFGIQGTPGFILNGVPVKGAYPQSHFDMIIDKLKEKKMIKI